MPSVTQGPEKQRLPYQPPQLRILSFEQASLFLVSRAWIGHRGAQYLLRFMFPPFGGKAPK